VPKIRLQTLGSSKTNTQLLCGTLIAERFAMPLTVKVHSRFVTGEIHIGKTGSPLLLEVEGQVEEIIHAIGRPFLHEHLFCVPCRHVSDNQSSDSMRNRAGNNSRA